MPFNSGACITGTQTESSYRFSSTRNISPAGTTMKHALTPTQAALREDIHILLATFMASETTARKVAGEAPGVIEAVGLDEAETASIRRRIAAVAIGLRMLSDLVPKAEWDGENLNACGTLVRDVGGNECFSELTLREACNKVVHATSVELFRTPLGHFYGYLDPSCHLRGKEHGKPWKASVSIYSFCKSALIAIDRYKP
ncbi:hypothetical protein [Hydrogenophaga luteola]|uniref:Uncharacterized protein n=1 Tax=Hydrogenophaga luteola TaxID=1591122 RepID=A0ABV7W487_9BURK